MSRRTTAYDYFRDVRGYPSETADMLSSFAVREDVNARDAYYITLRNMGNTAEETQGIIDAVDNVMEENHG